MQKTLTLLAGDSKERHNKGGGWKRVRKKLKRRGCALFSWLPEYRAIISMPGLPFATFASLSYSSCSALTPRRPVKQCQAVLFTSDLSVCLCRSFTNSLCIYCTCRLRPWRLGVFKEPFVVQRHQAAALNLSCCVPVSEWVTWGLLLCYYR